VSWTCTQIEEELSDYLDGMLGNNERREFEAHAAGCASCTLLLQQVGGLVGRMRVLEPLEEPPQLVARILDQTLGPRARTAMGWAGWLGWFRPVWQPRFALGAATVMATILIVFQATGIHPTKLTAADLNPANTFKNVNRHAHLVYSRGVKFVNDLRVVYEIQSRLRPEETPVPEPEQQTPPPAKNPQQKSEREGHPGRSANRGGLELAEILILDMRSLR
jgi:anti-sigma factor RsiW